MIGIYSITNLINNKRYIGQSVNITDRWRAHRIRSKTQETPLYRAIRKYGLDNFSFEVLEECSQEELNDKEVYWIAFYKANQREFGYNLTSGGDAVSEKFYKVSDEQVREIYELLRQGVTQQNIAKKFNITQQEVSSINLGETRIQAGVKYPIIIRDKKQYYCVDCGKEITYGALRCNKCDANYRVSILVEEGHRPSRDELKKLIRNTSFVSIGKMYNVTDNAVRKWCDFYKLPRRKTDIKAISDQEWSNL